MSVISDGFTGRRDDSGVPLPPGQYLTKDFPVLSAGPTPHVPQETWEFTLTTEAGAEHRWDFDGLVALGGEDLTTDLHCVTGWSKLGTRWRGVPVDALLDHVAIADAQHVLAHSYGGYTTNLPLADLRGGQAWLAFGYAGAPLTPEHGGPVRLLVPHLYLWKSAKWVRRLELSLHPTRGFWERLGYHEYGDPWREQRHWGD